MSISLPFSYCEIDLVAIFNMHNGAIASTVLENRKEAMMGVGVLQTKDNYKHNFWTEIRGGRRIDTFEVFKSKYTYLDK